MGGGAMVAQLTLDQKVAGSNPARPAIFLHSRPSPAYKRARTLAVVAGMCSSATASIIFILLCARFIGGQLFEAAGEGDALA